MRIRVGGRYLALMHGTIDEKFSEVAIWFKLKFYALFNRYLCQDLQLKVEINILWKQKYIHRNATPERVSPHYKTVTVFAKEKRRRRVIFYVWIHILTFSQNYAIPSLAGWAEWQQRGGGGGAGILGRRAGGGWQTAAFHPIINLVQFLDVRLVHGMYNTAAS